MGWSGAAHSIFFGNHQMALFCGHTDHRKWATLTLAKGSELLQRLWGDGQDITLLALVGPDLLRRQTRLFERHCAQIKSSAPACIVGEFRKGVGQTTCAHVVDGEDGIGRALCPAVVDDLLSPALDLGVATLNRVKVEVGCIGTGGHGTGRTAPHADAHARAAQLNQQTARREFDLFRLPGVNLTQTTGDHDGLVVAAHHAVHGLFVFTEITEQVGTTELVVESGSAQRAFGHDLQRAGDVLGLATGLITQAAPELGNGETCQTRLGLGATTGRALVPNLAASACRCAGKWRNRGRVVVGFHLHEDMVQGLFGLVSRALLSRSGHKTLHGVAFHHGSVVRIGHHRVLGTDLVGVADHAEQALGLGHAVDAEFGVENLVSAVLAVGLRKHHQLHIGRVALQTCERLDQVVDFVFGQGQTPVLVGSLQSVATTAQHVHMRHRRRLQHREQNRGLVAAGHGRFGHSVVQQRGHLAQLLGCQFGGAEQARFHGQAVFGQALNAAKVKTAVARDVCGFGGPR